MRAYERFVKYVTVHTASSEESETTPSTSIQFDLANLLRDEMLEMGIADARVDEHCYVYGSIPATPGYENAPCIGFIAHLDTIPDFSGENVKPTLVENYDGGDVALGTSGRILSPREFPHLKKYIGKTLIVTDGTTVLGADDKAGVAEIMTLAERLINGDMPHGRIAIGFAPDEEIGHGASLLDIPAFGADFGYTVDGEGEGGIEYENFNACAADFAISGFNVHPGSAKDTMINAALVAMEINSMLPTGQTPRDTEGYEGFFHLYSMEGAVDKASIQYIVRDHDEGAFNAKKATLQHIAKLINAKYGEGTVKLTIKEQYRNMIEKVKPHFHIVENALEAIKAAGLEPEVVPIRGGTDGAQLSFRGLPCPNLSVGGFACHGPFEHAVCEAMDTCVDILENIVSIYAKQK